MLPRTPFFRILLLFFLCTSLFLAYAYLKARPSYALYDRLNAQELFDSQRTADVQIHKGKARFVLFRQLRGAGFNNQVSECQS